MVQPDQGASLQRVLSTKRQRMESQPRVKHGPASLSGTKPTRSNKQATVESSAMQLTSWILDPTALSPSALGEEAEVKNQNVPVRKVPPCPQLSKKQTMRQKSKEEV